MLERYKNRDQNVQVLMLLIRIRNLAESGCILATDSDLDGDVYSALFESIEDAATTVESILGKPLLRLPKNT